MAWASAGNAADDPWRQAAREERPDGRRFPSALSVVAESRPQKPLGRSPGSEGRIALPIRWPLHLPRHTSRVVFEATRLHSQWRDRAGFAPVFPVMPSWAPKAAGIVTQLSGGATTRPRRTWSSCVRWPAVLTTAMRSDLDMRYTVADRQSIGAQGNPVRRTCDNSGADSATVSGERIRARAPLVKVVTGKAKRTSVDPRARRPAVPMLIVLGRGSPSAPIDVRPATRCR